MKKDFDGWNREKKKLNDSVRRPFFKEREIWWCAAGLNVGFEQDGSGRNYSRPIVVVKGFNKSMFFGVFLTGKRKESRYHMYLGNISGRDSTVVLSQPRLIDTRRLVRKMAMLDEGIFDVLKARLRHVLLP